jgi:hypothetical protein
MEPASTQTKEAMLLLLSLLNDPRLKQFARNNRLRADFLQAIGQPAEGEVINVTPMADRLGVHRLKIVKVMKDLQKLGYGRFRNGRHDHDSRLEWSYVSKGQDSSGLGKRAARSSAGAFGLAAPVLRAAPATDVHRISLSLRDGFTVDFQLPRDVTREEAQRLANCILALAPSA